MVSNCTIWSCCHVQSDGDVKSSHGGKLLSTANSSNQEAMGADIIVRTNVLAEAGNLPVGMEIYAKDRYSWVSEVAKTYEGAPPWPSPETRSSTEPSSSATAQSTNGSKSTCTFGTENRIDKEWF